MAELVEANGAPADEIARVIDTCPSGALSYTRTDGVQNGRRGRAANEDPTRATAPDTAAPVTSVVPVTISPTANGPLFVDGVVRLTLPDGSVEVARGLSLCRCGRSGAKPKCDGSHARVGFIAPGVAPGPQS